MVYDLTLPADTNGGPRPALQKPDRAEFVRDVKGDDARGIAPLTRAEMQAKWGRGRGIAERQVDKYIKWAKELTPKTEEAAPDAS